MNTLFHTPLSAPAERAGFVDATRDSGRATARSLEQLQGNQRSAVAQIVPMDADEPMHPADVFVIRWSVRVLIALALIFAAEWLFPGWFLP